MLPRNNLPKQHRHDGTSPLPLGMDWSSAPKKWNGKDTVWPHDPRTGWSYCVTIPSWIFLPESGSSDNGNPVVFYRVQVGIQSPQGVTTACVLSKRFSDFLRLFSDLKKAFPKKTIPQPPPKHALLRINSSRLLLEERRYALEAWMGKLLSDIELSRSIHVASFLELEAAARSSYQEVEKNHVEQNVNPSVPSKSFLHVQTDYGALVADGTSVAASVSRSVASDCGSDSAYETSDPELSRQEVNSSSLRGTKMGPHRYPVEDNLQNFSSTEGFPSVDSISHLASTGDKVQIKKNIITGASSNEDLLSDEMGFTPETWTDKLSLHTRKLSADSIGSDASSLRGSEISNPGVSNLLSDTLGDVSEREAPGPVDAFYIKDGELLNNDQIILSQDQRSRLNRVLFTIQRRLTSAKTDMEDLIARLNQEIAVKEYLRTKVKDLEVELESARQRSKEQMEQAIMGERERVTQIQWDMDELSRKFLDLQYKFKSQQDERIQLVSEQNSAVAEKETLMQELDEKRKELEKFLKRMEDLELKSKSDIKVLSKEVKSLRSSQAELKEQLNKSLKEKTELEIIFHKKMQGWEQKKLAEKKLLHECGVLQQRLQECNQNFPSGNEINMDSFSVSEMLHSLLASDNRIGLLIAEAQLIAQEDASTFTGYEYGNTGQLPETFHNGEDIDITDDELREMLTDIIVDNAKLRKEVNSTIRSAIQLTVESEKEGEFSRVKTFLSKLFER